MAKIYVASSWRNEYQQEVVKVLRELGHEVYDFKNPEGRTGFQWSAIDKDWQNWTTEQYRDALRHPVAESGFNSDFNAMHGLTSVLWYCHVDDLLTQSPDGWQVQVNGYSFILPKSRNRN